MIGLRFPLSYLGHRTFHSSAPVGRKRKPELSRTPEMQVGGHTLKEDSPFEDHVQWKGTQNVSMFTQKHCYFGGLETLSLIPCSHLFGL